jgi:hypothetical protein
MEQAVADLVGSGLRGFFCGINPGTLPGDLGLETRVDNVAECVFSEPGQCWRMLLDEPRWSPNPLPARWSGRAGIGLGGGTPPG